MNNSTGVRNPPNCRKSIRQSIYQLMRITAEWRVFQITFYNSMNEEFHIHLVLKAALAVLAVLAVLTVYSPVYCERTFHYISWNRSADIGYRICIFNAFFNFLYANSIFSLLWVVESMLSLADAITYKMNLCAQCIYQKWARTIWECNEQTI